jgi:hypothetical protein
MAGSILDFEVRLLDALTTIGHSQAGGLMVWGGNPSMSACVVGVPMCCRELLVMVLLDNPGSVGTAIIGLWVVSLQGTHVKRPQTHLNEDSVACIHPSCAWEVTGLSCNGAGMLALWTCLLLASQHGPPS